ncbi:MAG: hypothetical protein IPO48_05920, partial [Saprospiraceae bacterium]|nr:hypothetical protein [Saprospiraceae bacterium]
RKCQSILPIRWSRAENQKGHRKGGLIEERMYLDGVKFIRRDLPEVRSPTRRETLHIQDGTGRISMVDADHRKWCINLKSKKPLTKYIYSNHLSLQHLKQMKTEISFLMKYHPFGTSSYTAVNASIQTIAKRYKFTSKEG